MSNKIIVTFAIYYKKTNKFKIISNRNYSNLELIKKMDINVPLGTYSCYNYKLRNKEIDKWESDDFIIKLIDNRYCTKQIKLTKEFFIEEEPLVIEEEKVSNDNILKIIKDSIKVFKIEEQVDNLHKSGIINTKAKKLLNDLIDIFK